MNHARAIVAGRLESARGRGWRSVEGRSEPLGSLRGENVPGLRFKHTLRFALYRRTQKDRLVYGKR